MNRNLTLNFGLRYEWENGIKEKQNRAMLWFDANAPVTIASAAEAAYAKNPVTARELPGRASDFHVDRRLRIRGAGRISDPFLGARSALDAADLVRLQADG